MTVLILKHHSPDDPGKCSFGCGKKLPRFPAVLRIERHDGTERREICADCDERMTVLAKWIGLGAASIQVEDEPVQTRLDLDGDNDAHHADQQPDADVAKRIRQIAGNANDQGAAAFDIGDPIESNPYSLDNPDPGIREAAKRWNNGWLDAKVKALRDAGDVAEADELADHIGKLEEPTDLTAGAPDFLTAPAAIDDAPAPRRTPKKPPAKVIPIGRRSSRGKPN